jgi:hypothetical protein
LEIDKRRVELLPAFTVGYRAWRSTRGGWSSHLHLLWARELGDRRVELLPAFR